MSNNFNWTSVRQLKGYQILLAIFLPSIIAYMGFRVVLPALVQSGQPKVLMWPVVASFMLVIFTIVGFILIRKEAKTLQIKVSERLLLKKVSGKQWLICIGIMIAGIALAGVAAPLVSYMSTIPGMAIPDYMPFWLNPSINPMETEIGVLSPGFPLKGNYLVLLIMLLTLLLNITAEEVYFRAWLLPKMQNMGSWSWVVNACLFALYHTFQLWLFPMMIIVSLATTLTVYISKSIVPALSVHFVANFLIGSAPVLMLVIG